MSRADLATRAPLPAWAPEALRTMAADFVLAPSFAAELRRHRQLVGLSQSELAGVLAMNPSVISDYEQGRRESPGIATVRKLCEALLGVQAKRGQLHTATVVQIHRPLRVLDLFAGLGGWSAAFKQRGHHVLTLDWNEKFGTDLCMDVRAFAHDPQRFLVPAAIARGYALDANGEWWPDVVLASPDCRTLGPLGQANGHWSVTGPRKAKVRVPVTDEAREGVELARVTLNLVQSFEAKAAEQDRPFWWWLENPTGMLRYVDFMVDLPRVQVNYCRYGLEVQKPTDLWGRHPATWSARRPLCRAGDPCHKRAADGVVAMANAAVRAEVPYQLSLDVCLAVEAASGSIPTAPAVAEVAA